MATRLKSMRADRNEPRFELHKPYPGPSASAEEHREFEAKRRESIAEARMKASGLPPRYVNGEMGFDTFKPATASEIKALEACRKWASDPSGSILISGSVGVGKSHLVMSAIAAALPLHRARFVTKVDLLSHVIAAFTEESNERAALAPFLSAEVLAIDDLDKGTVTEFTLKTLWTVIDFRSREERATAFTLNADLSELYEILAIPGQEVTAESIVDRLKGMCLVVRMKGKSHR